ncbi:MAG: DUF2281 domain-containing protein [Chloroflexota bacterium]|nr:DUF2281 domain-containing protein [Chloroflexota bacterium]
MVKPLQELVQELPPEAHAEVRDFVEFLLAKRGSHVRTILRQDWAGALRNYREQYTSLELQRQALICGLGSGSTGGHASCSGGDGKVQP